MDLKFFLYGDEVKANIQSVGTGQPLKMEIMDQTEKTWTEAEIIIYDGPAEGAEPVGLFGTFGEPYDEGKYHVKVVRILSSLLDDDE